MSERKTIADGFKVFETPGMIRQVETHLVFGPLSRHSRPTYTALPSLVPGATPRQQAIVCFLTVKITLGIAAFGALTVGVPSSLLRHQSDALPILFLGLIWAPSIEFLPSVTPHQRYLTLARLLLTIPCVYFGVHSGYWHW